MNQCNICKKERCNAPDVRPATFTHPQGFCEKCHGCPTPSSKSVSDGVCETCEGGGKIARCGYDKSGKMVALPWEPCPDCQPQQEPGIKITEAMMLDCARFASFAQRVKMAYWDTAHLKTKNLASESQIDDILLIAWDDFIKSKGL